MSRVLTLICHEVTCMSCQVHYLCQHVGLSAVENEFDLCSSADNLVCRRTE